MRQRSVDDETLKKIKFNFDDERRIYKSSSVYLKVLEKWVSSSSGQDMKRETEMFENRSSLHFI